MIRGVTRCGFNWGVACTFDLNRVLEVVSKKLEPMTSRDSKGIWIHSSVFRCNKLVFIKLISTSAYSQLVAVKLIAACNAHVQ